MAGRGWNMSTTTDLPLSRRRRVSRLIVVLVAIVVLLPALALGGFRVAALLRESGPSAPDPEQKTVEAAGLAMRYMEWGPPEGRPLLLVHGTMAWSGTWRDIAAPLAAQGFRVIAPDIPPFGYSTRPASHDYSRGAGAGRILAFADALRLDRFALAVHSYGGGAAIEAAFIAPQRIDALVLLDVALGLGRRDAPAPPLADLLDMPLLGDALVSATFTNPWMIAPGLRDFVADDAVVTAERVDLYRAPLTEPGTTAAVRNWLFTGLYGDERGSRAADLRSYAAFAPPVLVVWGRDDTVTPLAQGEAIAVAFGDASLVVLDGVNHIPHVEKPQAVVDAMLDFLRRDRGIEVGDLRGSL